MFGLVPGCAVRAADLQFDPIPTEVWVTLPRGPRSPSGRLRETTSQQTGVSMSSLKIKPGTTWAETWARCAAIAPEAFYQDRLHNLIGGEWRPVGVPGGHFTPLDGTSIPGPPRVSPEEAEQAVAFAVGEHKAWGEVDLDERRTRVLAAVDAMQAQRDLLALLLVWEIGKPWRLACADVDRALDGVRWYVEEIERQLTAPDGSQRRPL